MLKAQYLDHQGPHPPLLTKKVILPLLLQVRKAVKLVLLEIVINCHLSVKAKRESLHTCIEMNKPHIIIGTESWLNEAIFQTMKSFHLISMPTARTESQTSVEAWFLLLSETTCLHHQIELDTDCEIIWVRIQLVGCKDLLVGAFYRMPDNKDLGYLEKLRSSLARINLRALLYVSVEISSYVISIGKPALLHQGLVRKPCLNSWLKYPNNLEQLVTEPTREDRILDLFRTNNPTLVQKSVIIPGVSDHDGIPMIDMLTHPKLIKSKPRKI